MNYHDTPQNAVEKPSGPKKRQSLFELRRDRFNDQSDTMSKKESLKNGLCRSAVKVGLKPRKKSSSPSSPSSHSFSSTESSPIRDEEAVEFLRYRGGSVSPSLYPELDGFKEMNDKLDLYRSTCNQRANQSQDTSSSSIGSKPWSDDSCPKFTPESKKRSKRNKDEESNWSMRIIVIGVFVLFVIFVYSNLPYAENSNATVDSDVFDDVNSGMNDIVKLFPSQDESIWSYFTAGIAEVKTKMHRPAVFLLLAPDDDTTAICLAKKVAEVTRSTLGGTGNAILSPDQLENDISKVFKLIEERVTRTKTVILLDLLNLKPQAIRALHDICDPDNSLVEEAVYLIIMKSELYKESENLVSFAEQQLNNSFSSFISEDILRPVITRITAGAVLPIRAEKNLPCSKYDIS